MSTGNASRVGATENKRIAAVIASTMAAVQASRLPTRPRAPPPRGADRKS